MRRWLSSDPLGNEFRTMASDLKKALSTFQRLMDWALDGLN